MKRKVLIFSMFLLMCQMTMAQRSNISSLQGERSYGIGYGLPFGGLGLRFGYNLMDQLNLFGGVGYQFAGVGFNAGLQKDFAPIGVTQIYVSAMYGSNAHIRLIGANYKDRIYLGPSVGTGVKINSRGYRGNYLDIGVVFPFTSSNYQNEFESIQNSNLAHKLNEPWPVMVTIGYNFNF